MGWRWEWEDGDVHAVTGMRKKADDGIKKKCFVIIWYWCMHTLSIFIETTNENLQNFVKFNLEWINQKSMNK